MSVLTTILVIELSVSIVILAWLFTRLWPAFRLDNFRQNVFAVRDEMFDYAASGKVSFNDPAYRLLRQLMNGFIRYAHRVTLFQLVMDGFTFGFRRNPPEDPWSAKWEIALANVKDSEPQAKLREFHDRLASLVVSRIITGSPLLWIALFLTIMGVLCMALAKSGAHGLKRWYLLYSTAASTTVSKVVDTRLLEDAAAVA